MTERLTKIQHWHIITLCLIAYDIVAITISYIGALWLRFDLRFDAIPEEYMGPCLKFLPIYIVISVAAFRFARLYNSIWRFASYKELTKMLTTTAALWFIHVVGITAFFGRMPITYYVVGIMLQFIFTIGIRFAYRYILLLRGARDKNEEARYAKNVMVIGAGRAGLQIMREIKLSKELRERVCCFIDDNKNKHGRFIEDIRVFGGRDSIFEAVDKFDIDKIYIAIPSASAKVKRDIIEICKETGCELKNLPGVFQIASNQVSIKEMRDVEIEDLLGREQIKVKMDEIFSYIRGKKILVTGGGGSIGSELCRQIAAHSPAQLIIFDIYENNAYEIQQELLKKYPDINLVTLIGSVRDNRRIFQVFEQYSPEIAFHAAAHKHVPLMEVSPCEAIKNNTIGTYNTAFAAMLHNCEKFVLISTDKAVNPTNCMGATKRSCEMVIQALDNLVKSGKAVNAPQLFWNPALKEWANTPEKRACLAASKTEFVAVRFGNVLGSNGSVIPLFKKQILAGGPVTVTHPDIIRYFMTIPEAVSLVLQAATYAREITYKGKKYRYKDGLETVLFIGRNDQRDEELPYNHQVKAYYESLVVLDPARETCTILHINNDTLTGIPVMDKHGKVTGWEDGQLETAHVYGSGREDSSRNVVRAVENMMPLVDIDHYFSISVDRLSILNDAVGGVTVTIRDDFSGSDWAEGAYKMVPGATVRLEGDMSELYIRRYFGMEDSTNINRMERQKEYMEEWLKLAPAALRDNPEVITDSLIALGDNLYSDMSVYALADMIEAGIGYQLTGVVSPEGKVHYESGSETEYAEDTWFELDKDALEELVVEIFYVECE